MKYEQLTFQPMSRPTNVVPAALLHGHDLAQEDRDVLHHEVAGLEGRRDAVRLEVPLHDRRVRVEVDRALVVARDAAEPAAHVDLADREAGLEEPVEERRRVRERLLEAVQLVARASRTPRGSGACPRRAPCRRTAAIASSSRSAVTPNFVGRSPAYERCSV